MKNGLVVMMSVVAVGWLAAQEPARKPEPQAPVQGPTFRTGVDVIAVDVAVVDARGNPVEDLLRPDFTVKIDGKERRIVSAEHVKIDVNAARERAANPFESYYTTNLVKTDGRLIVLAVDQLGIRMGSARPILASASKFLDKLSPEDRVAFVAYPAPGVSVDFTDDFARIRRAMGRVVGRQQRFMSRVNIGLYEAVAITERFDRGIFVAVAERQCGRLDDEARRQCERDILSESESMVRAARHQTEESLRGLYDLLRTLTVVDGPKMLILMSEGLLLDTARDLDAVFRMAAIARVTINVLVMDVPRDDVTESVLRPTVSEDRDMYTSGLSDLAGTGAVYQIIGSGENVFNRLASDMLAYYILAVEQEPGDRNGEAHRIDVEVRRRGVTVRSRRAFVLSAPSTDRRTTVETLMDALRAPFGVAEVPIRVTTFTSQDDAGEKVRLLLAAEVGQPGAEPEDFTVGYALLDPDGTVVASGAEERRLTRPDGREDVPLDYLREVVVDPGVYSLRLGVVDSSGRRGGVIRPVTAWQLAGEEFAIGDLMVGDVGTGAESRLRPGVEPHVSHAVGALVELHSTSPAVLDAATVSLEIAEDQDSPALLSRTARIAPGDQETERIAQGVVSADMLPPGRYVVRARVMRGDTIAGVLSRPFVLASPAEPADALTPTMELAGDVPAFDPGVMMASDVLAGVLDSLEASAPALRDVVAEVRKGRYGSAARDAFLAGDQTAASFIKGLEWYSTGRFAEAVTQLQIAAGPRYEFFPAGFYLGAALAAGGRDRDAAGVWQLAIGTEPRPSLAYTLFADARLRAGQPGSVIDVLQPAYERTPDDEAIGERLAAAYLLTERFGEALPVLDGYLSRHPDDHDRLFTTVYAYYRHTTRERLVLSDADLARVTRYVRAYRGPRQALLERYLEAIRGR